eukprot:TRINITY_DN57170_c0_g1_i1.p1 TRINITY_DN57170_c0_g1~~TRINITY_DN57170_c0_g1_i1.p1  ORF type:complete len:383 (-),score=66.64 TRINITY_DN57170_c0_g1_i1:54-1202(-)
MAAHSNGIKGGAGTFRGIVKSFAESTGWGFIECEQTFRRYGKDVFLSKRELPAGTAAKGDPVSFNIVEESNGPVAKNVKIGGASPTPNSSYYTGTVKSFNPQKGWGMIACPATHALYGKDMFFLRTSHPTGNAFVGEQVRFMVEEEYNGPVAKYLQLKDSQAQVYAPPAKMGGNGTPFTSYGHMAMNTWPYFPQQSPPNAKALNGDRRYVGSVKSFNEEKGWGHISCDATFAVHNKDVFLLRGQLEGQAVDVGMQASFKVTMGQKGPQASEVILLPAGTCGTADGNPGMVFTGSIKSFVKDKGWGFIAGEDVKKLFGKDIFLHRREIGDYEPTVGEELQFCVEVGNDSQPVAKNVVFGVDEYGPQRTVGKGGYSACHGSAPY